jgi:hypothetical protein
VGVHVSRASRLNGAFISLAFQWRGSVTDLSPLERALDLAGLVRIDATAGESIWRASVDHDCLFVNRCYDAGGYVSTTLDIEEALFDEIGARIGRTFLIDLFVKIGASLLRALGLSYVFFEEEAEADLDPEMFDGTRLFGITIVPDDAAWLQRTLARTDIQRVERLPGSVVIYRRLDPAPHLG